MQPAEQLSLTGAKLPTNFGNIGQYMLSAKFSTKAVPRTKSNTNPEPRMDSFETTEHTVLDGMDLLANDIDRDGDSLTIVSVTAPQHGNLQRKNGVYAYTPVEGVANVTDAFLYSVTDGRGGTATALVVVSIQPGEHIASPCQTAVMPELPQPPAK